MKSFRLMPLMTWALLSLPAHATDLEEGVVVFQSEGYDPENPPLLDTKGNYVARLFLETTLISGGPGSTRSAVKFKPILYQADGVCADGTAKISDTDRGKLIVKSLKFYSAHRADSGVLSCLRVGPTNDVSAPTVEHFLAARWAVDALKQPLISAFMADPFCQPGQFGRCSTSKELGIILDTGTLSSAKSCRPAHSNCVILTVFFDLKEARRDGIHTRIVGREFRVEYQKEKSGRRLKSYTFDNLQMPQTTIPSAK